MAEEKTGKTKKVAKSRLSEKPSKTTKQEKNTSPNVSVDSAQNNEANLNTLTSGLESKVAKAGKRSTKAIKETEEKIAKEERKAEAKKDATDADSKPKVSQKPARSRLERRSKNYRKSAELIDKTKNYKLKEALDLAAQTTTVKFDASVEIHIRLNVDPRQADQNIRQSVILPAGNGKTLRIAVFADADDVANAKKAGADIAGSDEFLQQLDKEIINFDVLIATPAFMPKLGKYARLLGPKGLMPNPKSGTVAVDIVKAVSEAKAGKVEYRVDSSGIIHLSVGKVGFGTDKLLQNVQAVFDSIRQAKPASVKGTFVRSVHLTTTMGPSILLSSSDI